MAKSLLEQLPEIVANGRKEAERILESLEGRHRVALQTREWVLPAKDTAAQDWITANERQDTLARHSRAGGNPAIENAVGLNLLDSRLRGITSDLPASGLSRMASSSINDGLDAAWTNRLIYGDNLLAMAALLAGDEHTPSLRGKIDLIYIDPPFDSKADYRTKVVLPSPASGAGGEGSSMELEQKPTVIEQFAYSDTWSDGTASYLAMITPRLILMRELLSDSGSIYVHLDWHVGHYVKAAMDEIFGKKNLLNEIIWMKTKPKSSTAIGKVHDTLYWYGKNADLSDVNFVFRDHSSQYVEKNYKHKDERGVMH
jgi:adenine-specific DNA-methyltransferase